MGCGGGGSGAIGGGGGGPAPAFTPGTTSGGPRHVFKCCNTFMISLPQPFGQSFFPFQLLTWGLTPLHFVRCTRRFSNQSWHRGHWLRPLASSNTAALASWSFWLSTPLCRFDQESAVDSARRSAKALPMSRFHSTPRRRSPVLASTDSLRASSIHLVDHSPSGMPVNLMISCTLCQYCSFNPSLRPLP